MDRVAVWGCVVLAFACGRIDFDHGDSIGDGGGGGDGGSSDGTTGDGMFPAEPRSMLSIDVDPVETLVDFPLLVVLDDTRAARDLMQPDASDLRFFDRDGNVLAHEIEQLGAPGGAPLVAWVRVPMIQQGAPTMLAIDYGRANLPPASTGSVWSTAFAGVWHLADLGDATTHNNDGAWVGTPMTAVAGIAGPTRAFTAASRRAISIADNASLGFTNALTVSGWVYAASRPAASGYSCIVSRQNGTSIDDDFWIGFDNPTGITDAVISVPSATQVTVQAQVIPLNTWTYVVLTYDGAVERLYVNGAQVDTMAITGNVRHGAKPIVIGADHNGTGGTAADDDYLDGMIDEVRLQSVARSPRWIAFDQLAVRDQVLAYGPVTR